MFDWTDRLEDIDPSEWEALLRAHPRPSPFLTPQFLTPWARSFAGPLRIGRWRRGQGLIFLHHHPQGWELLGGQDVADRLDALIHPGQEREFWTDLVDQAQAWGQPLCLPNLGHDSPLLELLVDLKAPHSLEETDHSPALLLPSSFEEYLRGLTRHQRHELLRKQRRALRLAPSLQLLQRNDIDEFLRLHRLSSEGKRSFMDARNEAFFRALAQGFEEAGLLRLALLEVEGRAVAAMWQIDYAGVVHLYNSGFDPVHRSLAPGVVLLAACLRWAMEAGMREYDFLRGQERYKYDLGGQDRGVFRVVLWP